MQATIDLPKAFSVRDDRELPIIQDLMARLNPKLLVVQAATGLHVRGGSTVNWGLVYLDGEPLTGQGGAGRVGGGRAGFPTQRGDPATADLGQQSTGPDRENARVAEPARAKQSRRKASIVLALTPTAGMVPAGEAASANS